MNQEVLRVVDLATNIELASPGAKWFIFGSFLRNPVLASDLDLLVQYSGPNQAALVRSTISGLNACPPVHLILLEAEEIEEFNFVEAQGAIQIFPEMD